MQCDKHPEAEAIGACTTCGKAVCEVCAVDVGGQIQCRDCLAKGIPLPAQPPVTPPLQAEEPSLQSTPPFEEPARLNQRRLACNPKTRIRRF